MIPFRSIPIQPASGRRYGEVCRYTRLWSWSIPRGRRHTPVHVRTAWLSRSSLRESLGGVGIVSVLVVPDISLVHPICCSIDQPIVRSRTWTILLTLNRRGQRTSRASPSSGSASAYLPPRLVQQELRQALWQRIAVFQRPDRPRCLSRREPFCSSAPYTSKKNEADIPLFAPDNHAVAIHLLVAVPHGPYRDH